MPYPPAADAEPLRRSRPNAATKRAVVVDGEPEHCAQLLKRLSESGFIVVAAHNLTEGLALIRRDKPALALIGRDVYGWRGAGGDDAVLATRTATPETRIVVMVDPCADAPPAELESVARPVSGPALHRLSDGLG